MYSVSEVLNDLNQIYSNGHARNTGQVEKLLGEWIQIHLIKQYYIYIK